MVSTKVSMGVRACDRAIDDAMLSWCMHGQYSRTRRGADLEGHDYLRGIEACVVVVELARLAQVREELACRRGRKQR